MPDARLKLTRRVQKMYGKRAVLFLNPDFRIDTQLQVHLRTGTMEGFAGFCGQRGRRAALPSIQSEVSHPGDADVLEELSSAAAADYHQGYARMARKAPEDFT